MLIRWLMMTLLVTILAACDNDEPSVLPPEEIIQQTADRLNQLTGFHFTIERTGAPAFLDPDGFIGFSSAEGDYVAPDKARAAVRVTVPGLVTDVSVIGIGTIQWQTNVVTGAWEELPPDWGFNPTVLFDPDVGLPAILQNDLSNLQLIGLEQLDDNSDNLLYKLTADVAGSAIYEMSGTLIGPDPVTAELWISPETFELNRILITEPVPDSDEPSLWQVDFSQFNQVVEIAPPV
jgi:lipoprotein LprG